MIFFFPVQKHKSLCYKKIVFYITFFLSKALVGFHLKYCANILSLMFKKGELKLEQVLRKAIKMIRRMESPC